MRRMIGSFITEACNCLCLEECGYAERLSSRFAGVISLR